MDSSAAAGTPTHPRDDAPEHGGHRPQHHDDPGHRASLRVTMLSDPDTVLDSLTTFRRRLLDLLDQPRSASGLARLLGTSRQRVNYHMRALESSGLVELVEERPRRGVTERFLQRRADVVLVDPLAFAGTALEDRDRIGITGLVVTARALLGQAATVATAAAAARQRVATATLDTEVVVANPAAMRAMLDDIARVIAAHASPGPGLSLRVATMALPAIAAADADQAPSATAHRPST